MIRYLCTRQFTSGSSSNLSGRVSAQEAFSLAFNGLTESDKTVTVEGRPPATCLVKKKESRGHRRKLTEREREALLTLQISHRIMSTTLTERVNAAGRIRRLTAGSSGDIVHTSG